MARPLIYSVALLLAVGVSAAQPQLSEDFLPTGAIARLGSRLGRYRQPHAHAFIDNGRTLLTVHDGPELVYCDVASGRTLVRRLGHEELDAAALSANGRVMVTQRYESLKVWDVETRSLVREFRHESAFGLSPDGSRLFLCAVHDVVSVDLRTGRTRLVATAVHSKSPIRLLVTQKYLLMEGENALRCLDLASGEVLWTEPKFESILFVRIVGNDQFWFDGAGADRAGIGLYELATGRRSAAPVHSSIKDVKFATPDGRAVGMFRDEAIRVYDVATGKILLDPTDLIWPLGFTPDGRALIGGDSSGYVKRWNLADGRPQYARPEMPKHAGGVTWLAYRPDGRSLLSYGEDESSVREWDLGTRRFRNCLDVPGHDNYELLSLLPDGRRLLFVPYGADRTLFDPESGKTIRTFHLPAWAENRDAFYLPSPNGRTLHAMISSKDEKTEKWDRWLFNWDTTTGKLLSERAEPHWHGRLEFSPDGRLMATGSGGVRDTLTGKLRFPFLKSDDEKWALRFSPDQSRLATTLIPEGELSLPELRERMGVYMYEMATGRRFGRLPEVGASKSWFTPDSRRLLTAWRGILHLWDLASGRATHSWSPPENWGSLNRDDRDRTVFAISSDGTQFATGHKDGTILLWPIPPLMKTKSITADEHDRLWADLAHEDADTAWAAIYRLGDHGAQALAVLQPRIKPTPPFDENRIRALIAGLAAEAPAKREAAMKKLSFESDLIESNLQTALTKSQSDNQKKLLTKLLDQARLLRDPERLRRWRAVVVLERIATPEARKLLAVIAKSPHESLEAKAAEAALKRLGHRSN